MVYRDDMLYKRKKHKKILKIHEVLFQSDLVCDNPKMEVEYF